MDSGIIQSIKQNVQPTELGPVDIFVISNGGIAEATERIVRALRRQFNTIRFIVPSNAFSAATLLCFSGDSIIMDSFGTLGPIDPQVGDKPARVILRAFDEVKRILKEEGPQALAAYLPLISKYDLPIIEICKTAEQLSKELATNWLSTYMFKCNEEDERVTNIVEFFSNYDLHKSHGRSIDRETARELGLRVTNVESIVGLSDLVRSYIISMSCYSIEPLTIKSTRMRTVLTGADNILCHIRFHFFQRRSRQVHPQVLRQVHPSN